MRVLLSTVIDGRATSSTAGQVAPQGLRWFAAAVWAIHGSWVLVNQLQGFLPGEALVGATELGAAIMIMRGGIGPLLLATIVALGASMASIAILGTAITAVVFLWEAVARLRMQRQ